MNGIDKKDGGTDHQMAMTGNNEHELTQNIRNTDSKTGSTTQEVRYQGSGHRDSLSTESVQKRDIANADVLSDQEIRRSRNSDRLSKDVVRNISLKRDRGSTFVTFTDFFPSPLDNTIPVCPLRDSDFMPDEEEPLHNDDVKDLHDATDEHESKEKSRDKNNGENESIRKDTEVKEEGSTKHTKIDKNIADSQSSASCVDNYTEECKKVTQNETEKNYHDNDVVLAAKKESLTKENKVISQLPTAETLELDGFNTGMKGIDNLRTVDNLCWVVNGKEIRQVDSNGVVKFQHELEIPIDDIATLSLSTVFLLLSHDKIIRVLKIESGQPLVTNFDNLSPDLPVHMCKSDAMGEVIATVLRKTGFAFFKHQRTAIRRYSYDGKIIQDLIPKMDGKFVFDTSICLSCNGNGDILIGAEKEESSHFVAVFGRSCNFRFRYNGRGNRSRPFLPSSICTTINYHIVINDSNNHKIDVIDKNGNFLKFILKESDILELPHSLSIDKDGNLWIGQKNGKVLIVKTINKYIESADSQSKTISTKL